MESPARVLVTLLWVAMCTAVGLWFLPGFPRHCSGCSLEGHPLRTFDYKRNPAAYLEYGRRMRNNFVFQVRAMLVENADLIRKFKAGDYQNRREDFEADTTACCNSLLESVEQFDGQQVPDIMAKSHLKISISHRFCYESVQALREAYGAEGDEQRRLLDEAENKLRQAWTAGDVGVKLHKRIWSRTAT